MNNKDIKEKLTAVVGSGSLFENTMMKEQVSFRVGGPADFLVLPKTSEELCKVLSFLRSESIPYYLMGNGSNLLVRDKGFRGVIVKTREIDGIEVDGSTITAGAGALLGKTASAALDAGLTGMEFASGIPGTLGGAIVMNAGAYGGEMKDIVKSVDVITDAGEKLTIDGADCDFGYRHSVIQEHPGWVVTRVAIALSPGDHEVIEAEMNELNRRRREKQPLNYPSAGSTFRRPEGYFAGKLIQDAGMKGFRVGGAMVSDKHSGFVVNVDDATAEDVLAVIHAVQDKVKEKFGVELQTEVITIGEK